MSKTRYPKEDEIALWREVTRDVQIARKKRARLAAAAAKRAEPKAAAPAPSAKRAPKVAVPVVPKISAPVVAAKLDGSTAERLRRGKIDPQASLDLHGLTQAQAHLRLATFIRRSAEQDLRCVLVVTGKGAPSGRKAAEGAFELHAGSRSGVLREVVPRWLGEGDMKGLVSGTHGAHVRHGGGGALYVYLKRKRVSR